MRDSRIFGVNQRGDGQWAAWTCLTTDDGAVSAGSFRELSLHAEEEAAHAAANAAREKHQSASA